MADNCTLELPDGRILGYALLGTPQGEPLFTCHGLPGSRMESYLIDEAAKKLNYRVITPDRPGYGLSTPHAHRTPLQWSSDITYLADQLDISTFNLIGISGGAPCALACAANFPHRIKKISLVCGLGPIWNTALIKNMHSFERMNLWLAIHFPLLLKTVIGAPLSTLAKLSPDLVLQLIGLHNGGKDREVLKDARVKQLLSLNIREAFRQGAIGAVHDMQMYTQPWGFQIADIKKSIDIWHGDEDTVVPLSHSEYMHKHLPNSRLTIVPGEAHFSLPIHHAENILREMR